LKQKAVILFTLKNKTLRGLLNKPTAIEIYLYKLNGQKVFTYKNNMQPAGQFNIDLKQINICSSLYVVRVKTAYAIESQIVSVE
jgi:hypothetical protein